MKDQINLKRTVQVLNPLQARTENLKKTTIYIMIFQTPETFLYKKTYVGTGTNGVEFKSSLTCAGSAKCVLPEAGQLDFWHICNSSYKP